MPEWTDDDGRTHRFVPTALPAGGDINHPFYLDAGPLFLVYSGLMTADDDLMRSALHYFRTGPNTHTYDLNGAWHQSVSLHRELSSCEPCYSWNVFHAWQSGDRPKFLEGMYSLLTGSLSRRTSIGCEHRGGVSGTLFSVPLPIELARLSVIDDQLEPDRLHLLRLVPLAWLRADRPTRFERIPTEFGPGDAALPTPGEREPPPGDVRTAIPAPAAERIVARAATQRLVRDRRRRPSVRHATG